MAKYKIKAVYEYEGVIEADDEKSAEKVFLKDLNDYYTSTEEYEAEEVCEDCEGDLDLDGSCFECRDDEEEVK